jgi:hypothetical protein
LQKDCKRENKSKQADLDLLTNNIDVSEIVSEQGYVPGAVMMIHGELILAIEGLAKDIGYSFSSMLYQNYHNEIE